MFLKNITREIEPANPSQQEITLTHQITPETPSKSKIASKLKHLTSRISKTEKERQDTNGSSISVI